MPGSHDWYSNENRQIDQKFNSGPFGGFPRGESSQLISPFVSRHNTPKTGRLVPSACKLEPTKLETRYTSNFTGQGLGNTFEYYPPCSISATYVTLNNEIYVLGGYTYNGNYLRNIWKYNHTSLTWSRLCSTPAYGSYAGAATIYNGLIYWWVGYVASVGFSAKLYSFDPTTRTFTLLNDGTGPSARAAPVMVTISDKIYLFGGNPSAGVTTNDMWEYNITNNTWAAKTSGASIRCSAAADVYNGKMYIHGGSSNASTTNLADMWEYDPVGDSWVAKAVDNANYYKQQHNMFVVGDYAYLCFGQYLTTYYYARIYSFINNNYSLGPQQTTNIYHGVAGLVDSSLIVQCTGASGSSTINDYIMEYNTSLGTQTTIIPYSLPRAFSKQAKFFEHQGKIILPGALGGHNGTTDVNTRVGWTFDPINGTLQIWPNLCPSSHSTSTTSAKVGNNVYTYDYSSRVLECYNLDTETWTTLATNTCGVYGSSMVAYGGNIYVFGSSIAVTRYNVVSDTWEVLTAVADSGTSEAAKCIIGNRIYLVGGANTPIALRYYEPDLDTFTTLPNHTTYSRYNAGCAEASGEWIVVNQVYYDSPGPGWAGATFRVHYLTGTEQTMQGVSTCTTNGNMLVTVGGKIYWFRAAPLLSSPFYEIMT